MINEWLISFISLQKKKRPVPFDDRGRWSMYFVQ